MTTTETKVRKLRSEGKRFAEMRGHKVCRFVSLSPTRSVASCLKCDSEVYVNASPAPNEIDLSGQALALDCWEARGA